MAGTRLHVVVSFVLFALAAAPFAWRFTQIERVDLPEARIQRLNWRDSRFGQPERFTVAIFTLGGDNTTPAPLVSTAAAGRIQYAPAVALQLTKTQQQELRSADNLQQIDDLLARIVQDAEVLTRALEPPPFSILLLCDAATGATTTFGRDNTLVVGKYRHAWSSQCAMSPDSALATAVEQLVQQHVFPVASDAMESRTTKRARVAAKYRLHFALLTERPDVPWRWAFRDLLLPRFVAPFVSKVGVLATFTVENDVVHYARLAKDVHARHDGTSFYINADDLKQFKSANDYLTTSVLDDREQVLHLLAALPALEHSPLGILAHDADAETAHLATSFEIPGWGAVAVLNTTRLVYGSVADQTRETTRVMGAFVAQLRLLLGAPAFAARQKHEGHALLFLPSTRDGIADWELDVIVRARLQHYLVTSIATLQSLVELVAAMPQMSVLKRVQQRIVAAVELLERILCIDATATSQQQCVAAVDLRAALQQVRDAAEHADAAYYDHTMIRQLYFPQEQMFGVYAPLLAPLILPFFVGLIREFKRWKTKRAAKRPAERKLELQKSDGHCYIGETLCRFVDRECQRTHGQRSDWRLSMDALHVRYNQHCKQQRATQRKSDVRPLTDINVYDALAIVLLGLGLAAAAAGGVGGGTIAVPLLVLVMGFDIKFATASSNFIIVGSALANAAFNLRKRHPFADRPLVDANMCLAIIPAMVAGAVVGAFLSKLLPSYVIAALFSLVLVAAGLRAAQKALRLHRAEQSKRLAAAAPHAFEAVETPHESTAGNAVAIAMSTSDSELLATNNELHALLEAERHTDWRKHATIVACYLGIVVASIAGGIVDCGSAVYWTLLWLEVPYALAFTLCFIISMSKQHAHKRALGCPVVAGDIAWSRSVVVLFPAGCVGAGIVAGLFGVGGAIVAVPLMLELGVVPEVAAATSALLVLYSSAAATAKFALFGQIVWDWSIALCIYACVVTAVAQVVMLGYVRRSGRQSIIVCCIAATVGVGACLMGYSAVKTAIRDANEPFTIRFCT